MLIEGLGRAIQADRQREIEERMRQRGLLQDVADAAELKVETTRAGGVRSIVPRSAGARSHGIRAFGRTR